MLIGYVRFCASHDPEDPISNMEIPLKFFDEVPSLCSRIAEYSCPSNKDEFEQHLVETLVKAYNQSLVRTLE